MLIFTIFRNHIEPSCDEERIKYLNVLMIDSQIYELEDVSPDKLLKLLVSILSQILLLVKNQLVLQLLLVL